MNLQWKRMGIVFLIICAGAVILGLFARFTGIGNAVIQILGAIFLLIVIVLATPYAFPSPHKDGES